MYAIYQKIIKDYKNNCARYGNYTRGRLATTLYLGLSAFYSICLDVGRNFTVWFVTFRILRWIITKFIQLKESYTHFMMLNFMNNCARFLKEDVSTTLH